MNPEFTDTLLRSQICEVLEQFDEEDFSRTEVFVKNQNVSLKGYVFSEKALERGLELVKKIRGVKKVSEELKIK